MGRIQSSHNFVPPDVQPFHGLADPQRYIVIKTDEYNEAMEQLRMIWDILDTTHGQPGLDRLEKAQQILTRKKDGEKLPFYLVLRLDPEGDDPIWTKTCRAAAMYMVDLLDQHDHLPQLAEDLQALLQKYDKEAAKK